jgi:hypothetical protein
LQFPNSRQTFQLPDHPLNWICTVNITVATFANYTSSDITERFLASNREKIIPILGTMLNRRINLIPFISIFEPRPICVLIDATLRRFSYVFKGPRLYSYINGNEYVYVGWILCSIASSLATFHMRSVAKLRTIIIFFKTILTSLFELVICLLEKDVGKKNCTKVFIGLIVICPRNTYKNFLTIELVFPRAGDAINNLTELIDFNFNLLDSVNVVV